MKHIQALLIKTLMCAVVLLIFLSLFNDYPAGGTIVLSLLISAAAYIIGDLFILPASNNMTATIADLGLSTLVIWWIGSLIFGEPVSFWLALFTGIVISCGEWLFHKYVSRNVLSNRTTA